jgi:hypothetical protein
MWIEFKPGVVGEEHHILIDHQTVDVRIVCLDVGLRVTPLDCGTPVAVGSDLKRKNSVCRKQNWLSIGPPLSNNRTF